MFIFSGNEEGVLVIQFTPGFSSVAEAKSELNDLLSNEINGNIETRLKGLDAQFSVNSSFFIDVTLMSLEVLRKVSTDVYIKEK